MIDLAADIVELEPCPVPAPGTSGRLREVAFHPNAWLPDEDAQLRALFAADEPVQDIAAQIGRPLHGVRARICDLGLRRNSTRPWLPEEEAELLSRYGQEPCAAIAADLGRSPGAVYARAQILSLSEEAAPGYDAWEDAQIRAGYGRGIPVSQIASLIGRTVIGVRSRAYDLGVRHVAQPPGWSDAETTRALELAETGMRYLDIIERLVAEGFPRRSKNGFGQRIRILGYGRGWGRPWSDDEEELLRRAYARSESIAGFARRAGRSRSSVMWKAGELGLQGTHKNKAGWRTERCWTDAEEEMLRAEYGKTPNAELAAKLDRKWSAIRVRANHLGLHHGWMRAFSEEEDRALLIAWREGISVVDLSAALKRDPSVVGKRLRRVHNVAFSDPDRPKKGPRTRRKDRPTLTLEDILILDRTAS